MSAWRKITEGVVEVLGDGLEAYREQVLNDDKQTWLDELFQRVDSGKLKKSLQVFGAGFLQKRVNRSHSRAVDELLLHQAGQILFARLQEARENQSQLAQQKEQIERFADKSTLKELRKLSAEEFEYWTGGYFERFGFRDVVVSTLSADFGVDVYVNCPDGKQAVVQCKHYKGKVGRPVVQQLYGVMKLLRAEICYVATTGGFTKDATELGKRDDIILLDGRFLASGKRPPGSSE